jgi:DnaJ-class molecular chaperone
MPEHQDPYELLEVSRDADDAAIKSSYKKLMRKWHPDRNKSDDAVEKTQEIGLAYGILSDPEKKKIYDKFGHKGLEERDGPDYEDDIISQMFGGGGGLQDILGSLFGGGNMQPSNTEGVPDLQHKVEVSLKDAYTGLKRTETINRIDTCNKCKGFGTKNKSDKDNIHCTDCGGQGCVLMRTPMGHVQMPCNGCEGTGNNPKIKLCSECKGNKGVPKNFDIEIDIPKGVKTKKITTIQNQGHEIPPTDEHPETRRTNLIIVYFVVDDNDTFKRNKAVGSNGQSDYNDLYTEIDLTFEESLVGFNKSINHLDNHSVPIHNYTPIRHGDMFVIKGQGMPKSKDHYGNLMIKFNVEHPKNYIHMTTIVNALNKNHEGSNVKKHKTDKKFKMIDIEEYKEELKSKFESEQERQFYKHRMKKHHPDDDSDDDGDDDGNDDGKVQCAQS